MRGESLKQFSMLLVSLARLTAGINDAFLVRRLNADMMRIVAEYTLLSRGKDNVAQYRSLWKVKIIFESLINTFEHMNHFQVAPATPLAKAQRALCMFYRGVLQEWGTSAKEAPRVVKEKGGQKTSRQKLSIHSPLTHNQKKIFTFIQSFPNARTKDIIDQFNTLSDRTVKRSLRELMDAGFITKRAEHKAVYYSVPVKSS